MKHLFVILILSLLQALSPAAALCTEIPVRKNLTVGADGFCAIEGEATEVSGAGEVADVPGMTDVSDATEAGAGSDGKTAPDVAVVDTGSDMPDVDTGVKVDVAGILFGHIQDEYGWQITEWGGHHITIPLPCIVYSESGWHVFMSSEICKGKEHDGFFIAPDGRYEGKIVERGSDGTYVRPFDISITKNVCSLMISSLILILLVLWTARWYRRNDGASNAPEGIAKVMEPLIVAINDSLVKDNIGKDYSKYSPYLLTVFFFILINNLLGLIPFFPGGANVTGNIAVTFVLALCTFIAVNLFANKHYWKDILWPDVPLFLKFPIPMMQIIEIFGIFTKPFSLMVRLFANIMAGHAMILGLVCVIFIAAKTGAVISGSMTLISVLFGVFMDCLELLVAFIQAYVFTMLSAVFIGMSRTEEE